MKDWHKHQANYHKEWADYHGPPPVKKVAKAKASSGPKQVSKASKEAVADKLKEVERKKVGGRKLPKVSKTKEKYEQYRDKDRKRSGHVEGDTVSFTYKGQKLEGTVIRDKVQTRGRKLAKELQARGVNVQEFSNTMTEISVPGKGVYTVAKSGVKLKKAGTAKDAIAAKSHLGAIKQSRQNVYDQRTNTVLSLLGDKAPGDKIRLRSRYGGSTTVEFAGVSKAGKVQYIDPFTRKKRSIGHGAVLRDT